MMDTDDENELEEYSASDEDDEVDNGADDKTSTENGGQAKTTKKNKKRKAKDKQLRRKIRKIRTEETLDAETLSARQEELERLRRLELQRSLSTGDTGTPRKTPSPVPNADSVPEAITIMSPVVVDVRVKPAAPVSDVVVIDSDEYDDADDDVTVQQRAPPEMIEIIESSASEEEEDDDDEEEEVVRDIDEFNKHDAQNRVLINYNHPADEEDVFLAPQVARAIKPHQIGGIRFLYNNLIESLKDYKRSTGFGCILAHAMGLGKTLQVIGMVDIFLHYTTAKRVLCIVPINTIQNWLAEFNMWLPDKSSVLGNPVDTGNGDTNTLMTEHGETRCRDFPVVIFNDNVRTTLARAKIIGEWFSKGGVLLMGYEMFRLLTLKPPSMNSANLTLSKKRKNNSATVNGGQPEVIDIDEEDQNFELMKGIQRALLSPGPDLVVCDEGHRIKNNQANISQALKKISTRRRVVLTGYPLQNNLMEYWCMVDFIRPNYLGSKSDFSNMFDRPIQNGQCTDSTYTDVQLMRFRVHILHTLLQGFVQRRSQLVLKKALPPKEEHVILLKISPSQSMLYKNFIQMAKESAGFINPILAFSTCTKIWNHPDIMYNTWKAKKDGGRTDSPLTVMYNDADGTPSQNSLKAKAFTPGLEWADDQLQQYQSGDIRNGPKMMVLFTILEASISVGDKVLVFSQSLSTLSMIEEYLSKCNVPQYPGQNPYAPPQRWEKNKNYYRLDGNSSSTERERMINTFNKPNNNAMWLFLLSTRAGCLGINLIGANRVVVFDVSWNPCHDVQAVCRVYRYGQTKPCFIYRLIADKCMEKKMYDRQITKQGMSDRVVDDLNPEFNFTKQEIQNLFFDISEVDSDAVDSGIMNQNLHKFTDPVLRTVCTSCQHLITQVPFAHESLLLDRKEMKLSKAEKRAAKRSYEAAKSAANRYSNMSSYTPTPIPRVIHPAAGTPVRAYPPRMSIPIPPTINIPPLDVPQTTGSTVNLLTTQRPLQPAFTGAPSTQAFTGALSTQAFTGAPSTQAFTGAPSTQMFTGAPGTQASFIDLDNMTSSGWSSQGTNPGTYIPRVTTQGLANIAPNLSQSFPVSSSGNDVTSCASTMGYSPSPSFATSNLLQAPTIAASAPMNMSAGAQSTENQTTSSFPRDLAIKANALNALRMIFAANADNFLAFSSSKNASQTQNPSINMATAATQQRVGSPSTAQNQSPSTTGITVPNYMQQFTPSPQRTGFASSSQVTTNTSTTDPAQIARTAYNVVGNPQYVQIQPGHTTQQNFNTIGSNAAYAPMSAQVIGAMPHTTTHASTSGFTFPQTLGDVIAQDSILNSQPYLAMPGQNMVTSAHGTDGVEPVVIEDINGVISDSRASGFPSGVLGVQPLQGTDLKSSNPFTVNGTPALGVQTVAGTSWNSSAGGQSGSQ